MRVEWALDFSSKVYSQNRYHWANTIHPKALPYRKDSLWTEQGAAVIKIVIAWYQVSHWWTNLPKSGILLRQLRR